MIISVNEAQSRFTIVTPVHYSLLTIVVPEGFVTDFASVPKIFWSIYPPLGRYGKAALLHDYLFSLNREGHPICSFSEANKVFRLQMKEDNVGWRSRWAIWLMVTCFGWLAWRGK